MPDSELVIAGCDSAKKGLAFYFLPGNKYIWIEKPKTRYFPDILEHYFLECQKIACDVVYIEDIAYVRNYKAVIEMSQILGIIILSFKMRSIPTFLVNVMTWKKDIVGHGRAEKETIQQFVKTSNYFSISDNISQDIMDAACICLWGKMRMREN